MSEKILLRACTVVITMLRLWVVRNRGGIGSPVRVCGKLGRLAEDCLGLIMMMKEWML